MKNTTLEQKYAEVKKQLLICQPYEKTILEALIDYYYGLLLLGGK